ncbi:cell envelope integrity protein CreD [Burkholderia cepacia]|uniref:Cell envelope integrity protein CreD n=1 Tax=Burkholderia cepacia TaxID=292 RepID=A0A8I1DJ16_BURCE|nr:cell envelope integrity protein CreD [Burkholderia cepacia]MBA9897354.1 cell envelope integrity protein CreD [Burkholderia cepacia]MBA9943574.1 cell envelope integrity protein CreD [Burkholderia cepacia]MBA9973957.1 cell envelope integrity protein CreD [Burkholderia cepacia]MBA9992149.1 cell envelope integrity protein CreD [Burkholderia cepacia]MBB0006335.1 cell envelope integrity protein CreD [Burkholderia cepacia]
MNRVLLFKFVITALLALLILIPLQMVQSIVHERSAYRMDALQSIWSSYAGPQTVSGPVLVVPYTEVTRVRDETPAGGATKTSLRSETKRLLVFPKTLNVDGTLTTSVRYRGIHKALVYELTSRLTGTLALPDLKKLPQADGHVSFKVDNAYVAIGIGDIRGLTAQPDVRIGGARFDVEQGTRLDSLRQGVHANVDLAALAEAGAGAGAGAGVVVPFSIDLPLRGAESVAFAPVGDQNDFSLKSTWPHPSFDGAFLPNNRTVDARGFTGNWRVTSFNTKAREQIATGNGEGAIETASVSMIEPVNVYLQAERATKYGALFVMLTFASFFMYELVKRLRIHPIQYALVGLSLALFFLLLLSLSEHIAFAYAYLAASGACIGLLGFYLSFVLHSVKRGAVFSALLAVLYAALYGLLLSEDNALMLGSLLLFAILAGIMTLTRRVDWYSLGAAWQPLADKAAAGAVKPGAQAK